MVFNTVSVGAAVTPTVITTVSNHYTNRKSRRHKPTAEITYDSGLNLIRQFLDYASHHTVEELQAFTAQWVPTPRWVKCDTIKIPEDAIGDAANHIINQLGHKDIAKIGGSAWWQWRKDGTTLEAEWIEMRSHYHERKKNGSEHSNVMLYVHGGAYFFGSVDEHRYQMQRHARKLQAQVLAPRYRLAPQYPFPCGLQDCLAAYLYLLESHKSSNIILAGDSAGGGMVLSMLVILRDQGIPLPAGSILISPWCDLTHSFPSVSGSPDLDYIPPHGFLQRPSAAWPPPTADDMEEIAMEAVGKLATANLPRKSTHKERESAAQIATQGFSVEHDPSLKPFDNDDNPAGTKDAGVRGGNTIPGAGHNLSIEIDGKLIEIKDQIQMYTTNQLISHPLVSPVLQPSLGGLTPLLILTGGGEMLRDEQIYVAHKAAHPAKYPPGEAYLNEIVGARDVVNKYPPTDVQLQIWDDLCHVAPTLSFTRPAKFMFRSVAQFGAWALSRAQERPIEILNDDLSEISSLSSNEADDDVEKELQKKSTLQDGVRQGGTAASTQVGKAGDPIPPFKHHMVRQRVDNMGNIYPLDPPSTLPALKVPANEIGVIKPGPVQKWMAAKKEWEAKYAREKRRVQKNRIKEMIKGYQGFGNDDVPPPSALAGRRGLSMPKEKKAKKSWGLALWSFWNSAHDKTTMDQQEKADRDVETITVMADNGNNSSSARRPSNISRKNMSRSKSNRRNVSYQGQTDNQETEVNENTTVAELIRLRQANGNNNEPTFSEKDQDRSLLSPTSVPLPTSPLSSPTDNTANNISSNSAKPLENIPLIQFPGTNVTIDSETDTRPKADGIAFPFSLSRNEVGGAVNASMVTLNSVSASEQVTPKPINETNMDGFWDKSGHAAHGSAERSNGVVGTGNGNAEQDETVNTKAERPGIDRFETASEML